MNLPQLSALAQLLAMDGWVVVRFTCKGLNLAYRIKVYMAVLEYVVSQIVDVKSWVIGGRSMGARAAVGVANDIAGIPLDAKVAGVVCISYPLHPKGDTASLRDGPLKECVKSLCFISGTRDEMCEKCLLEKVLQNVKTFNVNWIDDANHGLSLRKKAKGDQQTQIEQIMKETIVNWALQLSQDRTKAVDVRDVDDKVIDELGETKRKRDTSKTVKKVNRKTKKQK
ncbi:testis-expressed protein 30-like isoform X2 [Dreissena polymorpha]|nr:testis-expressed protein 30-like isoform X2 [Dreissena polymorpha]